MQIAYYEVIDIQADVLRTPNCKVPNFKRSRCSGKSACIIDYAVPIFLTRAVIPQQMERYFLKLICKLNLEISVPVREEIFGFMATTNTDIWPQL